MVTQVKTTETDGYAAIQLAFGDGERVITRGIQKVRPGQAVEVRADERFTHLEAS